MVCEPRHGALLAPGMTVMIPSLASIICSIPGWAPYLNDEFTAEAYDICAGHNTLRIRSSGAAASGSPHIDAAACIKVTNSSTTPREISSYDVLAKTASGWVELEHVSLQDAAELEWKHLSSEDALIYDISNRCLDTLAGSAVIQPGHSLRGWIFLSWGAKHDHAQPIRELQLVITDTQKVRTVIALHRIN